MRFEQVRQRLSRLPSPLPPPRAEIDAQVIDARPGDAATAPRRARRASAGPARDAAALVLLYPDAAGEARIVLTVRPGGDDVHAGQVALPGGKREAGDTFPVGTALREAAEEVGLDPVAAGVSTIGLLETVDVRVSGYMMVPVLAVADHEPELHPDEREVARVLTVPVRLFLPDAPVEIVEEVLGGWRIRYGAYPVEGQRVWGATGRVVAQLGAVLEATSTP